jgi:hypothetical protein
LLFATLLGRSATVASIRIIGERHSGTTWLKNLLYDRLCGINLENGDPNSFWKHEMVDANFLRPNQGAVIIVKDPYAWAEAMYKRPFDDNCVNDGFKCNPATLPQFLKQEWSGKVSQGQRQGQELDLDGQPFKNVMDMRTKKMQVCCCDFAWGEGVVHYRGRSL